MKLKKISNPRSVRSEYKMPVNRQVELVNRYNFNFPNYELRICKRIVKAVENF